MEIPKIINTHIEKTAGTSVEGFFLRVFPPWKVLIYSPSTDTLFRASTTEMVRTNPLVDTIKTRLARSGVEPLLQDFKRRYLKHTRSSQICPEELPHTDFAVIHGHFQADRFDDLIVDPFQAVVLRDPLERMWSHYTYWQRTHSSPTHRVYIPYDDKMTFEDYALHPLMQDYQAQSLGSKTLEDFDLVGITPRLDFFIGQLVTRTGIDGMIVSHKFRTKSQVSH